MSVFTFRGGIHPYDGKEMSRDKSIRTVEPKGDLVYPLSQHLGAPAKAVVKKGDEVLAGQVIGEADGFVSVPVHATVSGTVKSIEPRLTVTGNRLESIIVENDGEYREVQREPVMELEKMSKSEVVSRIREAGIVGMGGAGFPTHVKLSPKEPDKIEYILVNSAECEPYLTSDYRCMVENPEEIIGGLNAVLSLFDNAVGVIGIEDNKPDCLEIFRKLAEAEPRIEVAELKTKYPQGAERQLIYAITKRQVNSSMLPADAGCIVHNAETIMAVYKAVIKGTPLMHRIVTVTGEAIADPRNFKVRIGTNYHELIDEAGGFKEEPKKIISGGPMMGFGVYDLDIPTTKTSSALLCLTEDDVAAFAPTACINCGRCVSVCPAKLLPSRLADYAQRHEEEPFLKYYGMECCECGSCSYMCPAKRRITQSIKSMRRMIIAARKTQQQK